MRVVVNFALDAPEQAAIAAVAPQVQVALTVVPETPGVAAPGGASRPTPGWQRRDAGEITTMLAEAEVLFGYRFLEEWLDHAPRLRWIQLTSAGADHMLASGFPARRPDVLVTTASGIHAIPIAEHVIGMILAFARGFVRAMHNQQAARWERYTPGEAAGQVLGLVGYGPVGQRIAELAHALGMRVQVLRRSGAGADDAPGTVERWFGSGDLHALLAASDYVVLAPPLTAETRGMIDTTALAAMRPHAVLINIGRGALVVQDALVQALAEGRLAGAGLDVMDPEPLPPEHPLWQLPNVLITPHLAGSNPYYNQRATALFCANLQRYLAGQPLQNVVDAARGY